MIFEMFEFEFVLVRSQGVLILMGSVLWKIYAVWHIFNDKLKIVLISAS
jgi:hypothetical protein